MRKALASFRYVLVWLVATAACLVGLVPTATLLLTVPGELILPLATGLGALFAAIAASWTSNLFSPDRTRGHLLLMVGVVEIVAAIVAAGFLALVFSLGSVRSFMSPLLYPLLVSAGLIGLSATVAAGLLRTTEDRLERDVWMTLRLVLLGLLVVIVAPLALCSTVMSCVP